ncbi:MAG: hypothetical protein OXH31_09765 [Gammaproteobacteria bacterium]|nr:hypothetical protein [Gammaproteobacteria bacterium]
MARKPQSLTKDDKATRSRFSDPNIVSFIYDKNGRIKYPEDPEEIRRKLEWKAAMDYYMNSGDDRVLEAILERDELVEKAKNKR